MASPRSKTGTSRVVAPSVAPQIGIDLLNRQIVRGKELLNNRPLNSDDHSAWENTTREFLVKAFGSDSPNVERVTSIGKSGMFSLNAGPDWWENRNAENLKSQLTILESLVGLLHTEIELSVSTPPVSQIQQEATSRRIFIVHGHQEATREATARFLERLNLTPVILHEQPNLGRTIIEKFTDYSDVGFAVVLCTADDRGGLYSDGFDKQLPRARQNVLLELGFFLGKLGRGRVCALYQEGVEIPSDYKGVLFVKLDEAEAWKFQLAKELKAAGISVDMNLAI